MSSESKLESSAKIQFEHKEETLSNFSSSPDEVVIEIPEEQEIKKSDEQVMEVVNETDVSLPIEGAFLFFDSIKEWFDSLEDDDNTHEPKNPPVCSPVQTKRNLLLTALKEGEKELVRYYSLEWSFYPHQRAMIDFMKLESRYQREGQPMLRGIFYPSRFGFDLYPLYSRYHKDNGFSVPSYEEGNYLSVRETVSKPNFRTVEFKTRTLRGTRRERTLFFNSSKAPEISLTCYDQTILIVPSVQAGFFNRRLSIEARQLFPHATSLKTKELVEGKDYEVIWKHAFLPGSKSQSKYTSKSEFWIKERLLLFQCLNQRNENLLRCLLPNKSCLEFLSDDSYSEHLYLFLGVIYIYHDYYRQRIITPIITGVCFAVLILIFGAILGFTVYVIYLLIHSLA